MIMGPFMEPCNGRGGGASPAGGIAMTDGAEPFGMNCFAMTDAYSRGVESTAIGDLMHPMK